MVLTHARRLGRSLRPLHALAVVIVAAAMFAAGAGATTTWQNGDVFAGVAGGQYKVYTNAGVFKETISDGLGGFTTGCSFNPALDKLYTTNFTASDVVVYNDASPHGIAQTISTGKDSAESIVFGSNGHFFVGGPLDPEIEEYNAAGVLVDNDTVAGAPPTGGPDWIDLAADQKTMFYTTEGRVVKRFDVVADLQLADFAALPGAGNAFALRLLTPGDGSGGLLVADGTNVKRLDGSGAVAQTYDVVADGGTWFSLNLDPNGTSFWAGTAGTNNFYRFNIATGAVEVGPINTGTGTQLFGLCLKGEITAATGNIVLTPPTDQNEVGTSHTVTATVTSAGNPVPGELVSFSVTVGPNTAATGVCVPSTCITDSAGQVAWTYTGGATPGTDTIQACFVDNVTTKCATASKEWIDSNDPPSVDAGAAASGDEGSAIALDGTVSDPDGDTVTTAWTYAPLSGVDAGATCSFADATAVDTTITCTDDGIYTATLTGDDGNNPPVSDSTTVTVANVAPTVDITAPLDGALYPVNTAVNVSANLADVGTNDTHTCSINWDDGNTTVGLVTEANGIGTCTGSHSYTSPGVYTIVVTVTDDDGDSGTDSVMVVVFDPSAGFVTGGGHILSQPGSYVADPTLTGKATFGFVSKYKKGATVPTGSTEFQFHVASFNFHSETYQWLVVAGARAQYKGTGTVNGESGYSFLLTAIDGQISGGGGVDRFRIKIWNTATGAIVYDNMLGSTDDLGNAQALTAGSIVIHK